MNWKNRVQKESSFKKYQSLQQFQMYIKNYAEKNRSAKLWALIFVERDVENLLTGMENNVFVLDKWY